jgi:ankyrin repeat protein
VLKSIQGNAPIHNAASKGNLALVHRFVHQDASLVNLQNKVGQSPLHLAVVNGRTEVVAYLIRSGVSVDQLTRDGWTPLLLACECGDANTSRMLLDSGADVNFKSKKHGNSPLHRAANSGHLELAKLLLSRGADVNIRNNSNNTPLHRAVNGNYPEMVELLIANGAVVSIRNNYGRTPLKLATEEDNRKCGRILREHGARE